MGDRADPRMPSAAKPYVVPLVNPNDLPPDYSSLLAIIFGIAGVMMRVSNALPITLQLLVVRKHASAFIEGNLFSMSCDCGSFDGRWELWRGLKFSHS